jgi:hypothetical protein
MKKLFSIFLICLCVTSCASNKELVNKTNLDLPEWFTSPEELTGVGIAAPHRGGIRYQVANAELDARGNLATKIQPK